jgi:hypothetical protein
MEQHEGWGAVRQRSPDQAPAPRHHGPRAAPAAHALCDAPASALHTRRDQREQPSLTGVTVQEERHEDQQRRQQVEQRVNHPAPI